MMPRMRIFLLLTLAGLVVAGCGSDATKPAVSAAPDLPPTDSWNIDFSAFDQAGALAPFETQGAMATTTRANFLNAALRVAFVRTAAVIVLTPPSLAFAAAIHAQPTAAGDSTWLWTYSWTDSANQALAIHLTGRVHPDHVDWELRLTNPNADPPLQGFLWYSGESSLLSFSGYWILNKNVGGEAVPVARIDWTRSAPGNRSLAFENLEEGSENAGDTMTYEVQTPSASLIYHDASSSVDSAIAWNFLTGAGSIQVPDYNDGEPACWDAQRDDVACAP